MALFTDGSISSGEFGNFFSGVAGGVGDFMQAGAFKDQASGDIQQANDFMKAKKIALGNENVVKTATAVQKGLEERKILGVEGTAEANEGSANVTGGSAGDIMRSSMQQGSLAKSLIQEQGTLQERGWEEKAQGYQAEIDAANSAAQSAMDSASSAGIGGIMSMAGGVLGLFL